MNNWTLFFNGHFLMSDESEVVHLSGEQLIETCVAYLKSNNRLTLPDAIAEGHHTCKSSDGSGWYDGKNILAQRRSKGAGECLVFLNDALMTEILKKAGRTF